MNIKLQGTYKALNNFEWNDIPKLAIITGVNGVGKSQFLRLLYQKVTNPSTIPGITPRVVLEVTGQNFQSKEVGFWESKGTAFPGENKKFDFIDAKNIAYSLALKANTNARQNIQRMPGMTNPAVQANIPSYVSRNSELVLKRIEEFTDKTRDKLSVNEILYNLPEDVLLNGQDVITADSIEMIFYLYQMKKSKGIADGKQESDFGDPPWEILNEVITASGLPYIVNHPSIENISLMVNDPLNDLVCEPFSVKLVSSTTGENIGFNNLSGGEKVIMSLAFLLYYSEKRDARRRLLLLDEFDAHLHPSMVKQFFNVVYDVLVKKYATRVILSTHSPSTLALSPRNADCGVFEMKKEPTQFIQDISTNYSQSISVLTNGMITVGPKTKYIFVEDEDDVSFYSNVNSLLSISSDLIFIPASNRTKDGNGKVVVHQSGGKNAVDNWVQRFERFSDVFNGLIDKDTDNFAMASTSLKILNRYSIENYYADPIIIFAILNSDTSEVVRSSVEVFGVLRGTEYEIIQKTNEELQQIANHIFNFFETEVMEHISRSTESQDSEEVLNSYKELSNVEFVNGKILSYPNWILNLRGKDIYRIIAKKTGSGKINNKDLIQYLNGLKMIPVELADTIKQCEQ